MGECVKSRNEWSGEQDVSGEAQAEAAPHLLNGARSSLPPGPEEPRDSSGTQGSLQWCLRQAATRAAHEFCLSLEKKKTPLRPRPPRAFRGAWACKGLLLAPQPCPSTGDTKALERPARRRSRPFNKNLIPVPVTSPKSRD